MQESGGGRKCFFLIQEAVKTVRGNDRSLKSICGEYKMFP
jgi:hypothetical protein